MSNEVGIEARAGEFPSFPSLLRGNVYENNNNKMYAFPPRQWERGKWQILRCMVNKKIFQKNR